MLFLALTVISFTLTQAQDVDEIVADYFEAIGGKENWKNLHSIKMTANMSGQGMEFPGTILSIPPNKQRVEVSVGGQTIVQAYDGETAWWINPMMGGTEAQKMPEDLAEQMTSQEFEDALMNYKEKGHQLALEGKQEVEGAECYKLKLTKKNGDVEFHYFNTENGSRVMQETRIKSGQAKGQLVQTFLSDYQEAGDLLFPHSIEIKLNGSTFQKLMITEVKLNEDIDKTLFDFPKKN